MKIKEEFVMILKYKNNRNELIEILETIFADAEMNFPFKEKGKEYFVRTKAFSDRCDNGNCCQ